MTRGDASSAEDQWINHDPSTELQTLAQAREERVALQLRLGGASYVEIAEHFGITVRDANRRVRKAIEAEVPTELRNEVRALALARLDVLIKRQMLTLSSSICTPAQQERAEEMVLKIQDRIMDITGAREPIRIDTNPTDNLDEKIMLLVQDLTRPVAPAPDVGPPGRTDADRIDPEVSRSSGRWQGRMRRTGDRDYGDPNVP